MMVIWIICGYESAYVVKRVSACDYNYEVVCIKKQINKMKRTGKTTNNTTSNLNIFIPTYNKLTQPMS